MEKENSEKQRTLSTLVPYEKKEKKETTKRGVEMGAFTAGQRRFWLAKPTKR